MKTVEILQENADAAYRIAEGNTRDVLDVLFGRNITGIIDSYEAACRHNGKNPIDESLLIALGFTPKQIAGIKLEEITLAINKGKSTDIYNGKDRWYPVFYSVEGPSAFAFDCSSYAYSAASAGSGSRLSYHEKSDSDYSGKQFIDLWKEYLS